MIRADLSGVGILIVDDSAFICRLLTTMLRGFGAQHIHQAATCAEAVYEIRERLPDIVFVDWELGEGENGLSVVRFIRSGESPDPFVPIVMITSHTGRHRVIEARDAGVNMILAKPFSPQTVYARLLAVIARPVEFIRTKSYFGPDRRHFVGVDYKGEERRAHSAPSVAVPARVELSRTA